MTETEGVIRFQCSLERESPTPAPAILAEINHWRDAMMRRGWMGRVHSRYGGLGFGNISLRTPEGFLVSATQTGGLPRLGDADVALVTDAEPAANRLAARGLARPSSEAMTHAAIYAAVAHAGGVIHVHAPALWREAARLGLPVTSPSIPYGTPAMAAAIASLATQGQRLIAMGGHEDGILAWSEDLASAAGLLEGTGKACEQ